MKVLIVGGSSSLGRGMVTAFGRSAAVTATYRATPFETGGATLVSLDLTQPDTFPAFVQRHVAPAAPFDAVVSLAGVLPGLSLADYSPVRMAEVMTVNFTAQAQLLQLVMPHIAQGGSVLLVSSISAQQGSYDPIYAASKAALIGFMRSIALWEGKRLRCNCLAPSLVEDSTMHNDMSKERREHHKTASPTGALLQADDLARIAVDLCQPHWRHLNGQVIAVNGGRV